MKWFKDFVGFRDGAGGMGSGSEQVMSSSESRRLRPERLIGDSAMEIGEKYYLLFDEIFFYFIITPAKII